VCHPQQDSTGRRGGQGHQRALGWRSQLGGKPYQQRDTRGLQLALPGRQSQGLQENRDLKAVIHTFTEN